MASTDQVRDRLLDGLVIPACPLALNSQRKLDERRQRALCRYYLAAGAGGIAVGVHTTQFSIRDPKIGLFRPVLEIAASELRATHAVAIGGVCGQTAQAVKEAQLLREIGYQAGLLSLGAMREATENELIDHCRAVAETIPLVGFYLQPAVGGRLLPFSFWRRFAEIENVVGIKIAPFNRYQTMDVIRAVAASGRSDLPLYTGNDDNIVADLVTPFSFGGRELRIVGGLLGQWAVWTRKAAELYAACRRASGPDLPALLRLGAQLTDANAVIFDAAHQFAGCIPGIHELLRRNGLLEGIWCLDPHETLSSGQAEELDRVCRAYPHLADDEFIAEHRDEWLK